MERTWKKNVQLSDKGEARRFNVYVPDGIFTTQNYYWLCLMPWIITERNFISLHRRASAINNICKKKYIIEFNVYHTFDKIYFRDLLNFREKKYDRPYSVAIAAKSLLQRLQFIIHLGLY